jgi:hypothetical protein
MREHVFTLQDASSVDRIRSEQIILLASKDSSLSSASFLAIASIYSLTNHHSGIDGLENRYNTYGLIIQACTLDAVISQVTDYMVF